MHQAMICSFKVFQSSSFMKVLKIGIFGILAEWKMHYLANSTVTGMPYLPAKVELVSLNRFSSQGLWKWYNSRVFDQRLYAWRQHLMFCRFSRKRKFFGNWLWFSKMSHQRAFFYWIWRISKFQFWQQILYFYRQPLLIFRALGCWVAPVEYCSFSTAYSQVAADIFSSRHCPTWLRLLLFSSFNSLNSFSKLLIFYLESLQFQCQHVL